MVDRVSKMHLSCKCVTHLSDAKECFYAQEMEELLSQHAIFISAFLDIAFQL
jgi:hypothetical protein